MNAESSSMSKIERHKNFIIDFLYWAIIAVCIFIGGKYLLPVLLPFILAYGIAYLLNKPICRIAGESRRKRVVLSILLTVAFYVIGGSLLALIEIEVFSGIRQLISFFPAVCDHFIFPILEESFVWIENLFQSADLATLEFLESNAEGILQALNDGVLSITNGILSAAASLVSFVPSAFMKMVITIISTVFMTIDYETIRSFLLRLIPQKQKRLLKEAKDYLGGTLLKCIASYAIIFLITFLELWVGLTLIKIPYSMMIALIIAFLDILPILGTGSVLIPWGIIAAINGDLAMAVSVILLYIVITIIRNVVEPKLVGKQVGLHPMLALATMLIGLKFFGLLGMLGLPILLSFLKRLYDKKIICIGALVSKKEMKDGEGKL